MAPRTTEDRFRIVNEFLGFGDIDAPIWFFGIEEAGVWGKDPEKDQQQYDKYACPCRWFPVEQGEIESKATDMGRRYTKIYDIMSKLVVAITNSGAHHFEGWKEFRNEKLLQRDGITFQTNLFPLGKPSDAGEWPPYYKDLFGYGMEDRTEYERIVKEVRFPLLRSQWKTHAPKITVCFGSNKSDYFEELLTPDEKCEEFDNCKVSERSGIVLTPFFEPRKMSDSLIHKLAEKLSPIYHR